jgi:hypothetical protein
LTAKAIAKELGIWIDDNNVPDEFDDDRKRIRKSYRLINCRKS